MLLWPNEPKSPLTFSKKLSQKYIYNCERRNKSGISIYECDGLVSINFWPSSACSKCCFTILIFFYLSLGFQMLTILWLCLLPVCDCRSFHCDWGRVKEDPYRCSVWYFSLHGGHVPQRYPADWAHDAAANASKISPGPYVCSEG